MSLPVRFSPEAISDIARIYDYIASLSNEDIAAAYVARIYRYCLSLETFPERGVRRDDIWQGLRIVGFERKATIALEVTTDDVRIIRVFGRGRDVEGEFTP